MARRLRKESGRVFVFISDGELEEGQTWEAVQALAFYKMDSVIACVDVNGMQYDGATKDVMNIEPIASRIEAFGGVAVTVDGHDVEAIDRAIALTPHEGKPLFVLSYSDSTRGVPLLQPRKPHLHFVRFKDDAEIVNTAPSPPSGKRAALRRPDMELVDQVHERNLVEFGRKRPKVLVLSGDLTASTEIGLFKKSLPEQFVSMGMAEQNMLSWAGGLAREGFVPFLHTFAVFLYRRPLDQLEMSVCYPNLPVRLIGFLPGVSTPGGVTHQAIEDIAVLRGLPNMSILEVGDATDVESVLDVTEQISGPVYVRMMRGRIPRLFPKDQPMRLNRARVLSQGSDVAVLSTGLCTEEAMRAVSAIRRRGISIQHLHVSTLKPFSDPQVVEAVSKVKHGVITLENHTVIGGLGTAVAEVMAENGVGRKLVRLGVKDTYGQGASFPYLMRKHGIDAQALIEATERMVGANLGIGAEDLAEVSLRPGRRQRRSTGGVVMDLDALRQAVWEANTSLPKAGLVKWAQGNASGRDPKSGLVAIKPSGARLDKLQPDDIVIVDLDGKVVQGNLKPSIDTASHLYVYRQRDDVHGIVHTHSPCATSFALRGEPIPCARPRPPRCSVRRSRSRILRPSVKRRSASRSSPRLGARTRS